MHHIRSVIDCKTNPVYSNSITTGEKAGKVPAVLKTTKNSAQKLQKFMTLPDFY